MGLVRGMMQKNCSPAPTWPRSESPGFNAGRGLKLSRHCDTVNDLAESPGFNAGRGLKQGCLVLFTCVSKGVARF